jgi:A/G-specific adenine glycosylase
MKIHTQLLDWFKTYGRHDLPWRNTENVYHVYLSEVMLQQTQVQRVLQEYYPKFLHHFPTLKSLGEASLEEVHSLWSGLGYYSRATNLHKTAKLTQGVLPYEQKELQKLPGIGRYTASAICSFGYNQAVPVVDTNIKRVLGRLFALQDPKDQLIWEKAASILNHNAPKEHNLALMDLGASLCSVTNPQCASCPLKDFCKAKDTPHIYTQRKKSQSIFMELFYGIYTKENKIAFVKSTGPMYKNLLVLPQCDPIEENYIGSFKHAYTKYRLHVHIYHIEEPSYATLHFLSLEEAMDAHISSLTKKALKLVAK